VDPTIDFNWNAAPPTAGIPGTNFSVKWTGAVEAQYSETYTFTTVADDGIRLWVNGQLLVDDYVPQAPTTKSGSIALVAGQKYPIEIDYFQAGGGDVADLSWSSPSTPNAIIPQAQLFSTTVPTVTVPTVDAGSVGDAGAGAPDASGGGGASVDASTSEAGVDAGTDPGGGGGIDAAAADGGGGPTPSTTGLLGQYYPTVNLAGTPVTEIDPNVDFNWNGASPVAGVPGSNFSVRWTGQLMPAYSETYTFSTTADDGIRLWVNNALLIDDWHYQGPTTMTGTIALTAGQPVPIKVEYFQGGGGDTAVLSWQSPSTPLAVIPPSALIASSPDAGAPSGPPPGSGDGLFGTYYPALNFGGTPVTEVDPIIDFNWNGAPPVSGFPGSNFSVKWTGYVLAQYTETYTFGTTADDGINLFVNGVQLVSDWVDQAPTAMSGTISLVAGQKYAIEIDYFQAGGGDVAELTWSSPSTPNAIVPQSQLFSH
jgi:hypothetical protein